MVYKSTQINIKDLVPKTLYKEGDEDKLWALFKENFLRTVDSIGIELGLKMICNNWQYPAGKYGSEIFNYRGFRPQGCGVGTPTGAHYKGAAGDFDFYDSKGIRVPPPKVIQLILDKRIKFPYLIGLETDVNWNHIDSMDGSLSPARKGVPKGKIILFNAANKCKIV